MIPQVLAQYPPTSDGNYYEAAVQITTDSSFACTTYRGAKYFSEAGTRMRTYLYTQPTNYASDCW